MLGVCLFSLIQRGLKLMLTGADFVPAAIRAGNVNRRCRVGRDGDIQSDVLAIALPLADNLAAHEIIAGFHPRQVANDGRLDDDFPKARLTGLDAGKSLIKPSVQRGVTGMNMGVITTPLLPP